MNTHIYFCSSTDCNMEVSNYNGICNDCINETLSHETSECPGCGNDIYCGANGYCANCWVDRFGAEEEHHCSGEFDYESGCRICDDEDCPYSTPRLNSIASPKAVYNYLCATCDENFYTTKPNGPHERNCADCHLYAADVIQTWWRQRREWREACAEQADLPIRLSQSDAYDEYEGTSCRCEGFGPLCHNCEYYLDNGFPSEKDEPRCTCNRETGLMCDLCSEEYHENCRGCGVYCDLWNERYCRSCYEDRYVAKPQPVDIEADIDNIIEKLTMTRMTPGQEDDWRRILEVKQFKLCKMQCPGCRDGVLNQQGHMVQGGCLDEPYRIPWEDYDQDDLNKMDLANRRGW